MVNGPSKLLDKKWKQEQLQMHKKKLRSVKSTIREQYQSAPFGQTATLNRNGKKEALMECKLAIFKLIGMQSDTRRSNEKTEFFSKRCPTSCKSDRATASTTSARRVSTANKGARSSSRSPSRTKPSSGGCRRNRPPTAWRNGKRSSTNSAESETWSAKILTPSAMASTFTKSASSSRES